MLRGLRTLTWIELKIFLREPLGALVSLVVPVAIFVIFGRTMAGDAAGATAANPFLTVTVPVFASLLIVLNAVVSIVAIISIYREGGILKRLRATPLRPQTILAAHVAVKLLLTLVTLGLLVLAGRRFYPVHVDIPVIRFTIALLFSTWSILSVGFLIASIVPTARFAQPLAGVILYPMIAVSGVFVPLENLPPAAAVLGHMLPLSHAVSLMSGVLEGAALTAHLWNIAALTAMFAVCTTLSAKVFRWE